MNSVSIQARRRLIFRYYSLELTPREMLPLINRTYPASIDTIRRDLRGMSNWLPSMLSLEKGDVEKSLVRIIGLIHLAQDKLLELMYGADNDSARVGAAKSLASLAVQEAEIRMDIGQLPRVSLGLRVEGDGRIFNLKEYFDESRIERETKKAEDERKRNQDTLDKNK